MGAVKKLYDLMAPTTPRVDIEFITQASMLSSQGITSLIPSTNSNWRADTNTSVDMDWGDGTSESIALPAGVDVPVTGSGRHTFAAGFAYPVTKVVKARFLNPLSIKRLDIVRWWVKGNLSTAIEILRNLTALSITFSQLDSIPANIANLPLLGSLSLAGNPVLGGKIPSYIFDITSLTFFAFDQNNMGAQSYSDSRLDRLPELTNLTSINFSTNGFTEIPAVLFDIPNIISIVFQTQINNASISPVIPANASLRTSFKSIDVQGAFRSISPFDTWINNWYTFITTNASMTGASTLPFRGASFNANSQGVLPTGIFQQPAGYVQGSNNGTPASPYEKLWVLVNQYAGSFLIAAMTPTAIVTGVTTQITLNRNPSSANGNELLVGSVIHLKNITGTVGAALNNLNHTITNISGTTITISTDTSGLAYTSGGTLYRISI